VRGHDLASLAIAASGLALAQAARAEAPAPWCSSARGPAVVLRAGATGLGAPLSDVARQLAAGLARSKVRVCVDDAPGVDKVAAVQVEGGAGGAPLRIVLKDDVTDKTLERSIDLSSIPGDSRAFAAAIQIEELLHASWAEIPLKKRIELGAPKRPPPPEIRRVALSVLPPAPADPPRFRVGVGASVARFSGGLAQVGPELVLGVRALRWLETYLRFAYRLTPSVSAPHGRIHAQAALAGAFADFVWRDAFWKASLHFPQGVDAERVMFDADANPGAGARGANRYGVVISHGLGLRVPLGSMFSISGAGRFCWVALPAEAADDHELAAGISGVGAEGSIGVDAHF
jgi:hypothetical protein